MKDGNYVHQVVDNLDGVEGEIVAFSQLHFPEDWLPADAGILSSVELAKRIEKVRDLEGKFEVTIRR